LWTGTRFFWQGSPYWRLLVISVDGELGCMRLQFLVPLNLVECIMAALSKLVESMIFSAHRRSRAYPPTPVTGRGVTRVGYQTAEAMVVRKGFSVEQLRECLEEYADLSVVQVCTCSVPGVVRLGVVSADLLSLASRPKKPVACDMSITSRGVVCNN